jgi:tRNA nucleotidyltransferase (CCA-adding enzyme)
MNTVTIPNEVFSVWEKLEQSGFEAYLVGGCVRDLVLGIEPKDWDITTNALPENVLSIFPHSHYDNTYGTVRVINDETNDERLKVIEVTTYRTESTYSDKRRPDDVSFSTELEDDLKRRDFTINALALRPVSRETLISRETLVDTFNGIEDLEKKIIRTVGNAEDRFNEDALRILRAIRLATELGFTIEPLTYEAIKSNASALNTIAVERIRDEFTRIIMSNDPKWGVEISRDTGVLNFIIPELLEGVGVEQNQAHAYPVWEHLLTALQVTAKKNWSLEVRLAALFHDISKPETRKWEKRKKDWSFHGHEVLGARKTKKILERLKYPKQTIDTVTKLVRWHMFFSDTEQITLSAVRRMINNVSRENIWDLMNIRIADRLGMGRPKEDPYRLRKYRAMIEEALRDPITVKMLAVDGNTLMKELHVQPSPKIGYILHALLEDVLEDPSKNTKEYLMNRANELISLNEKELKKIGESGKEAQKLIEESAIKQIRNKHWVK